MTKRALLAGILIGFLPLLAFAHVVVKPAEAKPAAFQTFTMGVPSEKPLSTISLRLVLPSGLKHVTPNVKPGWTITVIKDATGNPTEIRWRGGRIPKEQRDEFLFSAQVPASSTTLLWKAYQTYSDGSTVSWDADPSVQSSDFSKQGPYSSTKVADEPAKKSDAPISSIVPLALSALALALSVVAMQKRS